MTEKYVHGEDLKGQCSHRARTKPQAICGTPKHTKTSPQPYDVARGFTRAGLHTKTNPASNTRVSADMTRQTRPGIANTFELLTAILCLVCSPRYCLEVIEETSQDCDDVLLSEQSGVVLRALMALSGTQSAVGKKA